MKKYNVAVIGVGAVGIEIIRCLFQRNFPIERLKIFARRGRRIQVDGQYYEVEAIEEGDFSCIHIALFAGTEGEKGAAPLYAQEFIKNGAVVIDNGGDFRLKEGVPLVVPEVNKEEIFSHQGIIANPNCTTIQMVVGLNKIHKQLGLERIILTSFQATSGAGRSAAQTLWEETKEIVERNKDKESYEAIAKRIGKRGETFPAQIAFNVIPQIGSFQEEGFTSEEWKVVKETHKIYKDKSIKISATCVRVPVFTAHGEAIYFVTKNNTNLEEIKNILHNTEGVHFFSQEKEFPLPLEVEGQDKIFVGRLRRDPLEKNGFWIWCVGDNLRKGAALNAVQIGEYLIEN